MFSRLVVGTHMFVPASELGQRLALFRNELTIRSKFKNVEPVSVYADIKDYFGFPRYYDMVDFRAKETVDLRSVGSSISFSMKHPPRPRQIPILNRFVQIYKAGKTGFLLCAPTGSGKTYMLLSMLHTIQKTALIVVPREYIVQQWIDRILEHTSLSRDDIGIVRQDRCEYEGKSLVVGLIHSLAKDKYSVAFKKWPGVVVFDEVHVTGAQTFSRVVSMFPAKYRIGATATPKRPDGMDPVFRYALGEVYLLMTGGTDLVPKVILCDYEARKLPKKLTHIEDKLSRRGVIISAISGDFRRNGLVAYFASKLARSGRRTLVLSDRKQQLDDVRHILMSRYNWDVDSIGVFVQETPKDKRQKVLNECQIILGTYGMMAMAVDVPDLSGLVFATPQAHVTQPIGRILRLSEDKPAPVVVDIVDTSFNECVRWAAKRKQLYHEMHATLHNFTLTNDQVV